MGGFGSGGKRVNSGRKAKTAHERAVDGNAGRRGRVLPMPGAQEAPSTAVPPIEEFDAPDDLTFDERKVWLELAPHAFENRTLTKGTALAFKILCTNVVILRGYATSMMDRGGADHRGMIARVDAAMARFCLAPAGKPLIKAAPEQAPANPVSKYLGRR